MAFGVRTWPRKLVARPWLLGFAPINAATAGFGVVLPLLILTTLHGNWSDVAVAATLFNGAVILSSIAWGHLTDRIPHRRGFLLVNYAGFAVLYLVLTQVTTLPTLYAIYAVVGALAPAGANAGNLLILEQFSAEERPTAFASFQEMSMVGSIAGLLIGYFWTLANDALVSLLFVLAGLALASGLALWFGIRESTRTVSSSKIAHHPESLLSRVRTIASFRIAIPFFPHRPRPSRASLRRFRQWAREELRHELPLILAAGFLFNLAANLFNISYTPYLVSAGLATASIFLVNFANNFAQTLVFPFTGGLARRIGSDKLVHRATYARCIGYLASAGLTFAVVARSTALDVNLVVYAVLGGAIAIYTTASSLFLFRGLEGRDAGSLLGLNSALGGVAAVLGAGLSGILAVYGSFRLVFLVSGGILLVSLPLWTAATVAYQRRRRDAPEPVVVTTARPSGRAIDPAVAAKTH